MKEIQLSKGQFALVDDEDYDRLVLMGPWNASLTNNNTFYAGHKFYKSPYKWGTLQMHRVIMGVTDPKIKVDHWNRNPLDNRKENLRIATTSQNAMNKCKSRNNKCGHKGIRATGNKWRADIEIKGVQRYLGTFVKIEDAVAAYKEAALELFKEFAYVN